MGRGSLACGTFLKNRIEPVSKTLYKEVLCAGPCQAAYEIRTKTLVFSGYRLYRSCTYDKEIMNRGINHQLS